MLLHSFEEKKSRQMYKSWKKYAKEFSNVDGLTLCHVDLTTNYFDGSWQYWTPLTRYYTKDHYSNFQYYYGDTNTKNLASYLTTSSVAY
jgi:hypothetical protein